MKTFAPEEISSMVLTKMEEAAEAYLEQKFTDAVMKVLAGMKVLRIIKEPTSAALAYKFNQKKKKKKKKKK